MLTLAAYTGSLRPHLPSHIITPTAFEHILKVAACFPGSLANRGFDLEIYLLEKRADLALHFRANDEGRQQLYQISTSNHHPAWQKIARYAAVWNDPSSLLSLDTNHAWLSFDFDQTGKEVPVPSIFYCSISQGSGIEPIATIRELTKIFRREDEARYLHGQLARCLQQLPLGASINQVGFGLLRVRDTLRLQILNFSQRELLTYLTAIGWHYAVDPLLPILEQFAISDLLSVMIDISTYTHPRIGIECVIHQHDDRWVSIFRYLIERGMCRPELRDFLVERPWVKLCQVGQQISLTRQRLSHLKINYDPEQADSPFEAKAYLAYYPGWLTSFTSDSHEEPASIIVPINQSEG